MYKYHIYLDQFEFLQFLRDGFQGHLKTCQSALGDSPQFWVFYIPKQKICAQNCGRINLERMAIVEIILLKRVSAIHFL